MRKKRGLHSSWKPNLKPTDSAIKKGILTQHNHNIVTTCIKKKLFQKSVLNIIHIILKSSPSSAIFVSKGKTLPYWQRNL